MATRKKKIATEAAETPKETAMESGTTEAEYQEPVVTAPVEVQAKDDTDISKKIYDIIEHEYPRTRVGTDGYLHAILCELIRARLRK